MSEYRCPECGASDRGGPLQHTAQCSKNDVSLDERLADIEARLDALEGRDDDEEE